MNKLFVSAIICVSVLTAPARAMACAAHLALNPDDFGFFGGAAIRLAGLAPPEPVFELEHPAMAKAAIGEKSEIVVNYERPFFSKNVRMTVSATGNVELLATELALEERKGSIAIPYQLSGSGYDAITLTVSGEHKGEIVQEKGRIYIRAKVEKSDQELQVSAR